jgi:long-chain fatty acid transport protein
MVNKALLFFTILIILLYSTGYSAEYMIHNQDAAAVAMGNSFTAIANNASAVFYNPAGINQLEGTRLRAGIHLVRPDVSFKGAQSRQRADMHDDISFVMMGYLTHKVNDKISIGGGIFSPFVLLTEWPNQWEGNTVSTFAMLRTYCANPVVSIQVNPHLSLAVGLDYVYSDFKLRRVMGPKQRPGIPLPISSGKVTLDGFDDTWGYNLGLLLHLNDRWTLGIAYRSKLKLEFDGHAHYRLGPVLQALYPPSDISPRIYLPPAVSADLSLRIWEKWTFATGITWTGWSVYDEFDPKLKNSLLIPPAMRSAPQDWRDVLSLHFGAQYQLNPAWAFRSGYIYDRSPVPEHTLGPMVPDSDGHLLCLGIGYTRGNFLIDVGCMITLMQDRHTRRNLDGLNGKYNFTVISVLISSTYYF